MTGLFGEQAVSPWLAVAGASYRASKAFAGLSRY
jgi:hypothetical protein